MRNLAYVLMLSAAVAALIGIGCGDNKGGQPVAPTAEYTLAIELTPIGSGSVDREPDKLTYKAGDSVTVTAKPKDGYEFSHWSGVLNSENDTITLIMNGNLTLTANFIDKPDTVPPTPKTYTLTISATVGGSVSPAVGTHTYDADTPVTVTAAADSGYTFVNWTGASSSTDTAITITMDDNKILTANFIDKPDTVPPTPKTHTLTISATDGGSVSPAVGEHFYEAGTSVTVTAAADSGYTFNKWSGASSSTDTAITITIDGDKTLTANFKEDAPPPPNTHTLTIAATVGGSVSPAVGEHFYKADTSVTVTAAADSGYTFNKWSGASSSTDTAITVKMDGDKTLTANFLKDVEPPEPDDTFTDGRDGKTYRWVEIGTQKWMAENLNYAAAGSKCYGEDGVVVVDLDVDEEGNPINTTKLSNAEVQANCAKYGRLYNWETALTACPVGTHLPSDAEWTALTDAVGGESVAGTKLKSSTGWNSYSGVPAGTDDFGWSALPAGIGYSDGGFIYAGYGGFWWSATEYDADYAYFRYMSYDFERVFRDDDGKTDLFSVRCVADP